MFLRLKELFRQAGQRNLLAISISGGEVLYASVSVSKGQHVIDLCGAIPVTGDGISYALKKSSVRGKNAILVLSPDEYKLLQVQTPELPEASLKSAYVRLAAEMAGYSPETVTGDYYDRPLMDKSQGYAVVALSENAFIRSRMLEMKNSGVRLAGIGIPEIGLRNVSSRLEAPGQGVVTVTFGATCSIMTLTAEGNLCHSHTLDLTAGEAAMINSGSPGIERVVDKFVLDIQRSLDVFERQFSMINLQKLMIGPVKNQEQVTSCLQENLYIGVGSFSLADILDISGVDMLSDHSNQMRFLPLIGSLVGELSK